MRNPAPTTTAHAPLRIQAFEPFDAGSNRTLRETISRRSGQVAMRTLG
ncbi:MAG: hypothetical protein V3T53_02135 [Phycisphaerales bacterium]